jgi:rhodanese-related sulfurtransferase
MVIQAVRILIISAILGLGVNAFSPNKIPYVGEYRDISTGDEPIIPPSAGEGDPPFIAIDVAQMEFSLKQALFVDARLPEEFNCGTIPGSVNVPFEQLPEGDLAAHLDSLLGHVPKDRHLVVFCSGEECDLSLHLARNFQQFGYTNLSIFFGGAREWEKAGMELERREKCE